MATGTKTPNTSKEQDAAYNPGDAYYNDEFNRIAKQEELADLEASLAATNWDKEGTRVDAHGDKVRRNYNADDDAPDENIKKAKDQEEAGVDSFYKKDFSKHDTKKTKKSFSAKMSGSKAGPTGGLVGILLFATLGVGGASTGLASSLLINIKELFHNDRSDATAFNRIMSRAAFSNKMNNEDGCSSKIAIKCKASTMSQNDMKRYHDQGFKITGAEVDKDGNDTGKRVDDGDTSKISSDNTTRIKVESVKFPDGDTAASGKDFWEKVDSDIEARRWAERSSPSRAGFYLNKFFSDKILAGRFDTGKGKRAFPDGEGNDGKNAQHAAFNDQSGGLSEEDVKNGKLDPDIKKLQDGLLDSSRRGGKAAAKGGAAGEIIQMYCTIYQMTYRAKTLVKAYHMVKLVQFGMMFLQAADEIKRGAGDGPKTTYLSDNLTYYDNDPKSEKYNLSATDSEGYKIATHGDKAGLKEFSKKYLLGGSIGQKLESFANTVASPVTGTANAFGMQGTDHQKMKSFCRIAQSDTSTIIAACAALIPGVIALALGSAGTLAPLGVAVNVASCQCTLNAVNDVDNMSWWEAVQGGTEGLKAKISNEGCNGLEWAIRKGADWLVNKLFGDSVKEKLAEVLREVNVGSDTKGVDAGNAIAAGSQLMLSVASMGYGLRPAKTDNNNADVTNYISATQPLTEKYEELAKADARETPFDAGNKYSLMGTLVRSFNLGAVAPTSLYGNLTTLSTLIPTSFKTLLTGEQVNAMYSQPSTAANGASGRYDHCEDSDLKDLNGGKGVTGDTFCYVVGVVTPDEIKTAQKQAYEPKDKSMDKLLDWMLARQEAKEEDGGTLDDDDNCANLDGSDDDQCENSKLASIEKDGTPVKDSQYSKYLKYCTEQREAPIGTQLEPYEQGSDRDQRWYNGDQCTSDSAMMKKFRAWTNYCLQLGTSDGSSVCYEEPEAATPTNSTCGDGTTASIYTCAVKFDNYRYEWGGGHGDIADLVKRFNAGEYDEWTPLVDCSGLIRAAAYDAFGVVTDGGATPSVYQSNPHWREISKEDAKMGDIVSLGNSDAEGHVVIVKSNNPGAKQWEIFHASTSGGAKEDNILHGTLDYGGDGRPVVGVYRFVK